MNVNKTIGMLVLLMAAGWGNPVTATCLAEGGFSVTSACPVQKEEQCVLFHGLRFQRLPQVWDEGIPLGNGIVGALIWQKGDKLRLALDRADLWDLRPVKEFSGPNYSFRFLCEAVKSKNMKPVYDMIDARTSKDIAPTKIPAGAIEIPIDGLGSVESAELDVHTAVCTITWENGATAQIFTNAADKVGHFRFTHLPQMPEVQLVTPAYEAPQDVKIGHNSLARLGYKKGKVSAKDGHITYRQKAYGDVAYEIDVRWKQPDAQTLEGTFCLTTEGTPYSEATSASKQMKSYAKDFATALREHIGWWKNYWEQCSLSLPDDPLLERQWYLEMYKFGAASRKDAPPICLQAVWTADNGQTPPWRGDFHNDLNTQLSYWPGYAANHLEESAVFTDWLWQIKENSEAYTRQFFGVEGLNVPCVSTLDGKNLGGWNPYSHQPTASGWLAQHFYLQWKYSADDTFLRKRAYPWVKEAARYFENISVKDENGKRQLPLSSSPEINDNRLEAWFKQTTNFDLACIRFTYQAAIEMAKHLQLGNCTLAKAAKRMAQPSDRQYRPDHRSRLPAHILPPPSVASAGHPSTRTSGHIARERSSPPHRTLHPPFPRAGNSGMGRLYLHLACQPPGPCIRWRCRCTLTPYLRQSLLFAQ